MTDLIPNSEPQLLRKVGEYYDQKLEEFGATPGGVDWNGLSSQTTRFEQLYKIVGDTVSFSMNDLGCGYGAFYDFIAPTTQVDYCGLDISEKMRQAGQKLHPGLSNCRFESLENAQCRDYAVASGIFNVRLDVSDLEWKAYVEKEIERLDSLSEHGFAFNMLTSYSDLDKRRPHLFYADPLFYFDYCKRRFSKEVALLHDYGLYEFTILVRKKL